MPVTSDQSSDLEPRPGGDSQRLKAQRDELAERVAVLEARLRQVEPADPPGDQTSQEHPLPAVVVQLLRTRIPSLATLLAAETPLTTGRLVDCFGTLIDLMRMLDRTVLAQLAVLGKGHARIREMVDNLDRQRLLDIDAMMGRALAGTSTKAGARPTPLLGNYCGLLLRWVSAILAGTQGTLLDVGNRLRDALNPERWKVPKGGFFTAEESLYWSYYKEHIKPNLPLEFEDELKRMCADKVFEAYGALKGPLLPSTSAPMPARREEGA